MIAPILVVALSFYTTLTSAFPIQAVFNFQIASISNKHLLLIP